MSDNILNNDSGVVKPVIPDVPTINPNSPLPPFKAWVQMAIPTVYDESLSYAELLYKVINYLNVSNEHLTNNDNIINELHTYMDVEVSVIQNWFKNLNVDDEVDRKVQEVLDLWASPYDPDVPNSGKMEELMSRAFGSDISNLLVSTTNSWLTAKITNPSNPPLDTSLLLSTAAANSKTVGDVRNSVAFNSGILNYTMVKNASLTNQGGYNSSSSDFKLLYEYMPLPRSNSKVIISSTFDTQTTPLRYGYIITTTMERTPATIVVWSGQQTGFYNGLTIDYSEYINNPAYDGTNIFYLSFFVLNNAGIQGTSNVKLAPWEEHVSEFNFSYENGALPNYNSKINTAIQNLSNNVDNIKEELEDDITLSNDNIGNLIPTNVGHYRIPTTGYGISTGNSYILYQYIPLPKKFREIRILVKDGFKTNDFVMVYSITKNKTYGEADMVLTKASFYASDTVIEYGSIYDNPTEYPDIENLYLRIHLGKINDSEYSFDLVNDSNALQFIYKSAISENIDNKINGVSEKQIQNNIINSFVTYDVVSNYRLSSDLIHTTYGTNSLLYEYIPLNKNNNKIIVMPPNLKGNIVYAITTDKTPESLINIQGSSHYTNNGFAPYVIDYSEYFNLPETANIDTLYMRVSFNATNTSYNFNTVSDKNLLTFYFESGLIPKLLFNGKGGYTLPASECLYNDFGNLSTHNINHIKDLPNDTRTYIRVSDNTVKTTVENFIKNNDNTLPCGILTNNRYVFTKTHLTSTATNSQAYDINAYYIQNIDTGMLLCGYVDNETTDDIKWSTMGGGNNEIVNNFSVTENNYNTTYTGDFNVTPTIVSNTNYFLQSTNNNTDRTSDILTMLTNTGTCILGKGVFYVSGVEMPENTRIQGVGNETVVIWLTNDTKKFIFKMRSNCNIDNLTLKGQASNYSPFYSVGDASGQDEKTIPDFSAILYSSYLVNSTTTYPLNCKISNVSITNCAGSGIKTVETTGGNQYHLLVENCDIDYCDCGIYNGTRSEFHKFTNVHIYNCFYGCVVWGGNIAYNNCTIACCHYGATVKGGSNLNDSHGLFNCVLFVHAKDIYGRTVGETDGYPVTDGYHIYINGINNGEKFMGCSIGYGAIKILNSSRPKFSDCGLAHTDIYVKDSSVFIMESCILNITQSFPIPTVLDNVTNYHIINCFTRTGTNWNV